MSCSDRQRGGLQRCTGLRSTGTITPHHGRRIGRHGRTRRHCLRCPRRAADPETTAAGLEAAGSARPRFGRCPAPAAPAVPLFRANWAGLGSAVALVEGDEFSTGFSADVGDETAASWAARRGTPARFGDGLNDGWARSLAVERRANCVSGVAPLVSVDGSRRWPPAVPLANRATLVGAGVIPAAVADSEDVALGEGDTGLMREACAPVGKDGDSRRRGLRVAVVSVLARDTAAASRRLS